MDLTTWYLADPLQPGVTVKGRGEERCEGQVVEHGHKKVSQCALGCLVRTRVFGGKKKKDIITVTTVKRFYDASAAPRP